MDIRHFIVVSCIISGATGCGNKATIQRINEPDIEARIVGSEENYIDVRNDDIGVSTSIPWDRIRDIDHPGNVAATIGGVLTGYGIINIVAGVEECDTQGAAFCTGIFLPAAIGLPLLIYGTVVYTDSVGNTRPRERGHAEPSTARISATPIVSLKKDQEFVGAGMQVVY